MYNFNSLVSFQNVNIQNFQCFTDKCLFKMFQIFISCHVLIFSPQLINKFKTELSFFFFSLDHYTDVMQTESCVSFFFFFFYIGLYISK